MDNDIKRLTRLTAILTQLQSKRLITARKLADKFGVSNRTIYRDMKTLERAGVPIVIEEGKGFRIMDSYRLPPIMFTEEEANALLTAELIIQSSKDSSLIQLFSEVTGKVRSVLPDIILSKTERLEQKMGVSNTYIDQTPKSKYLIDIQKALVDCLVIRIDYTNKAGQCTQRSVEPFAIYSNQYNEWVLVAFCQLRQQLRSFSLVNIDKLLITNAGFEPQKITFTEYLNKAFGN
ncbi:helix-turn-helix transcriptional regulator [Xanthocytophaga flava]|uniref:helix-turn-helix transcriptional regulator n=1 Tax=Xanthocytophaga flava TaxID=3048013 RepID=UPI0028D5DF68|nr:YafY family protein [Xanthocytophaga flavus]MDJ1469264.1 YafY family protein [Xanthocytophaga flavus]